MLRKVWRWWVDNIWNTTCETCQFTRNRIKSWIWRETTFAECAECKLEAMYKRAEKMAEHEDKFVKQSAREFKLLIGMYTALYQAHQNLMKKCGDDGIEDGGI